jgi:hypothetical protein
MKLLPPSIQRKGSRMSTLKTPRCERPVHTVAPGVDAATAYGAEGSAAVARTSRLPKTAAEAHPIANVQTIAPPPLPIAKVTAANLIREFEEARLLALDKGQASAAVTATMAKARLAGLLKERPESNPEPEAKFDGNYTEAARRIALLLRLAADETASGQKR